MGNKVSVIIPAFNAEKTIIKTIESVLSQTYINFELLIVNDGSTDKTYEILNHYQKKDSRVRVIHKDNGGVSSARNLGIEKSSGNFIAFLDADDYYHPKFLEHVLNPNKEINFCFYNNESQHAIKKISSLHHYLPIYSDPFNVLSKYLGRKLIISSSNWILSKKMIEDNEIRFYEDLNWAEDILFFASCLLKAQTVGFTKEYLTYYVQHDYGNRLSTLNSDRFEYELVASQRLISKISNSSLSIKQKNKLKNLIIDYRFPGTIVYGMLQYDKIPQETLKFLKYTENITLINGLRSLKLKLFKIKLTKKVKTEANNVV